MVNKSVKIAKDRYYEICKSGVKMSKIVAIEWEKATPEPVYYKNYKTWGWQSSPTKLMVYFKNEDGTIIGKNVYNFILKKLGWKKLSEKRYSEFHDMFIGKIVNSQFFIAHD